MSNPDFDAKAVQTGTVIFMSLLCRLEAGLSRIPLLPHEVNTSSPVRQNSDKTTLGLIDNLKKNVNTQSMILLYLNGSYSTLRSLWSYFLEMWNQVLQNFLYRKKWQVRMFQSRTKVWVESYQTHGNHIHCSLETSTRTSTYTHTSHHHHPHKPTILSSSTC